MASHPAIPDRMLTVGVGYKGSLKLLTTPILRKL
jgi:hypothetical protein